jgi:hypothetical protein
VGVARSEYHRRRQSLFLDSRSGEWDAALYSERPLKRSSLDQMWTVGRLNNGQPNSGHYGFGWEITNSHGHRLIDHDGAWQGFKTQISRYVDGTPVQTSN